LYGIDNPIDAASSGLWGGFVFLATAAFIISDRYYKLSIALIQFIIKISSMMNNAREIGLNVI